ncbi:MAG: phenylacetate--CoA ligase family protein, partial [Myxococcaceae bacterium]
MEPEDPRERRAPEERERALMKALPAVVAHAFAQAPAYRRRDAAVVPEEVTDRRALARLPLIRKSELAELQRGDPPFGGFSAVAAPQAARLFASPGGVYELEPRRLDPWRAARALRAAGFRAGDVVHNSFSYHLTPAASMVETGAHALGCAVIPAGTAPTEAQVAAAVQFRATAYGGTPSFLKVLLDRA